MTRMLVCVCACVVLFSCNNNEGNYRIFTQNPILFTKTVKRLNDIVLENNFPPMIATRNYAYASIAAYECIAAEDSCYNSLSGQIKHLPNMPDLASKKDIDFQFAAVL